MCSMITTKSKKKTVTAILALLLILCVLGIAGTLLFRHFVTDRIMDRGGMENPFPPIDAELPEIPEDAVLCSLNWGQSASNEYESFRFDLTQEDADCLLSGRYVDPENDRVVEAENVRLSGEDRQRIAQCLRDGDHTTLPAHTDDETVYDETRSSLAVCWITADSSRISAKYDGRGEDTLAALLKSLLAESAEDVR